MNKWETVASIVVHASIVSLVAIVAVAGSVGDNSLALYGLFLPLSLFGLIRGIRRLMDLSGLLLHRVRR